MDFSLWSCFLNTFSGWPRTEESADISTSVNFNLLEPQRQRIDRVISQSSHPNPPTIEQSCPNASLEDNRHKRQSKLQEEHLAPLTPKLRIEQVQAIVITVTLPSSPVILTSSQPRKLGILLQSLQNRQVNFQLKCPTSRMRDWLHLGTGAASSPRPPQNAQRPPNGTRCKATSLKICQ